MMVCIPDNDVDVHSADSGTDVGVDDGNDGLLGSDGVMGSGNMDPSNYKLL